MASTTEIVQRYTGKANGVYREIIDETSTAIATSSTNVVVLIQSERGPFMRPIYVRDADELHAIFGNRNAKLEAKGSFGIIIAEHVLETGPIWVLNLKNIEANNETLQSIKLACNGTDVEKLIDEKIATVYDTTKFWKIDPLYGTYGDDALLTFASILNGSVTVVVSKYDNKSFNYTVAETKQYNPSFLGDGLDDSAFVSDYIVQVDVFKTDLTKANINIRGAIVDGRVNTALLTDLRNDVNAKHFKTYTGSIGNVIDKSGNNLSIVPLINADSNASGVWCAINADDIAINGIDLLGIDAIEFSETGNPTTKQVTRLGETFTPQLANVDIKMSDSGVVGYTSNDSVRVADVFATNEHTGRVSKVRYIGDVQELSDSLIGTNAAPVMPDGLPFPVNADNIPVYPATSPKANQPVDFIDTTPIHYYNGYVETNQTWTFSNLTFENEDTVVLSLLVNGVAQQITSNGVDFVADFLAGLNALNVATFTVGFDTGVLTIATTAVVTGVTTISVETLTINTDQPIAVDTAAVASNVLTILDTTIEVNEDHTKVRLASEEATENDWVDIDIVAVKALYGTSTKYFEITFDRDMSMPHSEMEVLDTTGGQFTVYSTSLYKLNRWNTAMTTLKANVISGIVDKATHYVNGTLARQNEILDKLTSAGFVTSFTDPTIFNCRYFVDSFKTYIAPNQKQQIGSLANKAKRFLAFIAAPFYHELRSSKNPSFYDTLGNFSMEYVALGSNPDVPSTNSFSYANDIDNGPWIIPCMNVTYNDGFADKVVPSTGMVAKYYYAKHFGAHKVWDIVAGQDWPLSAAGVVGPEFETGPDDRAAMQSMGTNVLQVINGTLQLRTSLTAYQATQAASNYPETLEKVLFVADYCEPILNAKMFKYNNAASRNECKSRADEACDMLVSDGAISSYKNICDLSNNPVEVRKAGFIILDTELYNEYGILIAVHRITIKNSEE